MPARRFPEYGMQSRADPGRDEPGNDGQVSAPTTDEQQSNPRTVSALQLEDGPDSLEADLDPVLVFAGPLNDAGGDVPAL